ncbi:MAG TPA: nucleotidyltransferase domain-containing protein [Spirochaetota bacterium]|jgi:hypothetical protein|nr:MAG: Nucleotidyltransferase domain protein [Spirochaetes bacterium ADurb.Bin133]HNZ25759.1 nucleotidyltransferase domain-containing protein [Spirochaetota bacterium]HOF00089.1 nucleotidyltransferase domain-containing protein [Spirochaetota bacterium]HOS31881.1 nucleotidyltransferase domain-containing protein [Spirochaetota bacterium]HOS54468.1 nucleotidyltransferase domain-containing protein [Spirochaetota bacterium]
MLIVRDKIINEYQKEIKRRLKDRLKKIILFGSRARGNFNEWSDYDFAIIVDKRNDEIEDIVDTVGGNILTKYSKLIGPIVWDEKEWEFKKEIPIGINIIKYGIEL